MIDAPMTTIGESCTVLSGGTPRRSERSYWVNGSIPWVKIGDMQEKFIDSTEEHITEEGLKNSATKLLPSGTVIYSIFASLGTVGVLKIPACTNQAIAALIPKSKNLSTDYLYHWLKSQEATAKSTGRGATQNNINLSILKAMSLPLPSLEAQTAIASNFEHILTLKTSTYETLVKLDELVKSRFIEMFGDPSVNSKELPISKLSDLGTLARGKSKHRPRNAPELLGGSYPLIQTGDIARAGLYLTNFEQTYSEFGLSQSQMWPKGTLCITIAANIAQTSILKIDACFPDSVVGFTAGERITELYMCFWFEFFQGVIEAQAPQAAQKNINLKILSNLDVITPPLPLQQEFADFVTQVDKLKLETQQAIDKIQMLYDSLAQEYFGT